MRTIVFTKSCVVFSGEKVEAKRGEEGKKCDRGSAGVNSKMLFRQLIADPHHLSIVSYHTLFVVRHPNPPLTSYL